MKMNSVNKKKLIGQLNIYRSVLILLVICVFATILSPSFLSVANLFNVFKQITVAGIVGCGMTFVIILGGVDLSVGAYWQAFWPPVSWNPQEMRERPFWWLWP